MRSNFLSCVLLGALVLGGSGCHKSSDTPAGVSAAGPVATGEAVIQTKAAVVEASDSTTSITMGVMAAYEPKTRSFWWRPTPMIAEPSMLERFYERCKFFMNGGRVVNICVNGPELVTSTTNEYADSIDAGLEKAEKWVRENGAAEYKGPHDAVLPLKAMGEDMTTAEGQAPAAVQSVKRDGIGYVVEVGCGCGDRTIYLNRDFMSYKIVRK